MLKYLAKRVGRSILTLFIIVTLVSVSYTHLTLPTTERV